MAVQKLSLTWELYNTTRSSRDVQTQQVLLEFEFKNQINKRILLILP